MTPDPVEREKYSKNLEINYLGVAMDQFNVTSQSPSEVTSKSSKIIATTAESKINVTTTTSLEDSDEDYGDPDVDDALKLSCIAALCAGR